jgi:pimeloyl-ACP methyl ester carboxylesterase
VTPRLARDYRVVRIDLPSHGGSSDMPEANALAFARALEEVARRLELAAPHLVGHSLGGIVVSLAAGTFPAASVVNVDQPFFLGYLIELVRELEPRLRGAGFVDAMIEMMDRTGGRRLSPRVHEELCRYRARGRQDFVMSLWTPLLKQSDRSVASLVEPLLAQIRCPYLSLLGHEPGASTATGSAARSRPRPSRSGRERATGSTASIRSASRRGCSSSYGRPARARLIGCRARREAP